MQKKSLALFVSAIFATGVALAQTQAPESEVRESTDPAQVAEVERRAAEIIAKQEASGSGTPTSGSSAMDGEPAATESGQSAGQDAQDMKRDQDGATTSGASGGSTTGMSGASGSSSESPSAAEPATGTSGASEAEAASGTSGASIGTDSTSGASGTTMEAEPEAATSSGASAGMDAAGGTSGAADTGSSSGTSGNAYGDNKDKSEKQ